MILLENSDAQRKHYERKCEDMASRLRDTERTLQSMQADMKKYQVCVECCTSVCVMLCKYVWNVVQVCVE